MTTLEQVIERLKAAGEKERAEEYKDGKAAGRSWAEQDATPGELRRIARYIERSERENVCWFDVDGRWEAPYGATDYFVLAAQPSRNGDRGGFEDFWENALGEDHAERIEDADFFHGFGDGVVEVWDEVKDEL